MKKLLIITAAACGLMGTPAFAQCAAPAGALNCQLTSTGIGAALSFNGTQSINTQTGVAFGIGAAAANGNAFGQGQANVANTGAGFAATRAGAQGATAGFSFSSSGPGTGSVTNTTLAQSINNGAAAAGFTRNAP